MPEPDEPPAGQASAAATLASVLRSLRNTEIAIGEMIAREDYTAAGQFAAIARQHSLEALEAALTSTALSPSSRPPVPVDDIRHAERRLGIEPGTFTSFFGVNFGRDDRVGRKALEELLVEVRDDLARSPVEAAPRETPSWLPTVIRVASAVLVGTLVGAPLAALAVGEPVVVEIVKAGIAVTACAVAAEVTNRALENWLQPSLPAESPAQDLHIVDPPVIEEEVPDLESPDPPFVLQEEDLESPEDDLESPEDDLELLEDDLEPPEPVRPPELDPPELDPPELELGL